MEHGICKLSLVPMRAEPSDKAEMVTQVLFGECYEVVKQEGNWVYVQLASDIYQGWIDYKQHTKVTASYFEEWKSIPHPRVTELVQFVEKDGITIPVSIGSYLPFLEEQNFQLGNEIYTYKGEKYIFTPKATTEQLVKTAYQFMSAPYLWGGKSVFGLDCSGFMQQVFGVCGYQLPRDAYQQVAHGEEVHFAAQTQPGDLAFFSNTEGRIVHVGMMLENQKIIHAHGEVRIDTLDHTGIYNADRKAYSHQLRIIKRIF